MVREDLCRRAFVVVELARGRRWWREFLWASVRARRREERFRARSSSEGGSPKMKNLMKQNVMSAMESWPSRKPWVKDNLRGLVGLSRSLEEVESLRSSLWDRWWRWDCEVHHLIHLCGVEIHFRVCMLYIELLNCGVAKVEMTTVAKRCSTGVRDYLGAQPFIDFDLVPSYIIHVDSLTTRYTQHGIANTV